MAASASRYEFSRKMKSEELLEWLRAGGLTDVDLEKIKGRQLAIGSLVFQFTFTATISRFS